MARGGSGASKLAAHPVDSYTLSKIRSFENVYIDTLLRKSGYSHTPSHTRTLHCQVSNSLNIFNVDIYCINRVCTPHEKIEGNDTHSKDRIRELLEGGGCNVELSLCDLDHHLVLLGAGFITFVFSVPALAAPVVEDGDLRRERGQRIEEG